MSERHNTIASRLGEALLLAPDVDALQKLYVSNDVADAAPELQRAMLKMFQAERNRRETDGEFEGVLLPEFAEWNPAHWMMAGVVIIAAAETASMTGDPGTMDFAFALLQWWFLQISTQVTEAIQCAQG